MQAVGVKQCDALAAEVVDVVVPVANSARPTLGLAGGAVVVVAPQPGRFNPTLTASISHNLYASLGMMLGSS